MALWLLLTCALFWAANWEAERQKQVRLGALHGEVANLAQISEAILAGRLRSYDDTLRVLRKFYADDPAHFHHHTQRLRSGPLNDRALLVVVVGADGRLAYTDSPNVAAGLDLGQRPYFRYFADGGTDRFFIDEPVFGRVTRRYSVPLVRPIYGPRGDFRGVVSISVRQDALADFGPNLHLVGDAAVTVVTEGGSVVTRSHDLTEVQGTHIQRDLLGRLLQGDHGVFATGAAGAERIIGYHRIDDTPLIIYVAVSAADVLNAASQQRTVLLAATGLGSLLILLLLAAHLRNRQVTAKFIATQQAYVKEAQRIAGMGSFELDLAGNGLQWSDEMYRLFMLPRDNLKPDLANFLALVDAPEQAAVKAAMDQAVSDAKSRIEFRLRRGDAEQRVMLAQFEAVRNKAGQVASLIGTVRDITAQKHADQALRDSERRYRDLVENMLDLVTRVDKQGRFEFVNRSAATIFGLPPQDCIGQSAFEFVHPEDREATHQAFGDWLESAAESLEFENRLVSRDGAVHLMHWNIVRNRDASGAVIGFSSVARDITQVHYAEEALKQSEVRHRTLFEATADAVLIVDSNGIVDCNAAALKIFGAPSRAEFLGLHPSQLSPATQPGGENSSELAERNLAVALEKGSLTFEWMHWRLDTKAVFQAEVLLSAMEIEGCRLVQGTVRDITERKKIERKLENQKEHLEELVGKRTAELSAALESAKLAEQTKDAFLANMSHELRTPLSAVIGMANLAQGISTEPKLRDYLDKIVTSGKHLNRIINELLDLSKIAAGRMEFEITPFSLRRVLEHVESVMAPRAAEKGLAIVKVIDAAAPDALLGDPTRVTQIFLNLLGNAIKFTHAGRVEIRVSLHQRNQSRVCLDIEIEDSGIGMRPADLAQLFQPFSQADASVSRKYGGTGLGLTISRRLAEMMDGDISVTSVEGSGTTFKVRIWLDLGNAADLPPAGPVADETLPQRYRDVRILVAEDQPLNREIVEALLGAVGIAARMAENGQLALEILTQAGPAAFDLVLMDIQMPIIDGLTATRALRSRPEFGLLPIIGMTAHTMAHEQRISSEAGMNDHIGKPFDNASFYRTLAKWIPAGKQIRSAASAPLPEQPAILGASASVPYTLRGVDVCAGLRRFNGNQARYRHWLADFAETAGRIPDSIRQDIAAGLSDNAHKTAHTFKGRVGMLGMTELHGAVSELESALREGKPAAGLVTTLEQSVDEMCDQLISSLACLGQTSGDI